VCWGWSNRVAVGDVRFDDSSAVRTGVGLLEGGEETCLMSVLVALAVDDDDDDDGDDVNDDDDDDDDEASTRSVERLEEATSVVAAGDPRSLDRVRVRTECGDVLVESSLVDDLDRDSGFVDDLERDSGFVDDLERSSSRDDDLDRGSGCLDVLEVLVVDCKVEPRVVDLELLGAGSATEAEVLALLLRDTLLAVCGTSSLLAGVSVAVVRLVGAAVGESITMSLPSS
jgi:hypothetical protein